MWAKRITTIAISAVFIGVIGILYSVMPDRISQERIAEAETVQEQISKAEEMEARMAAKAQDDEQEEEATAPEAEASTDPFQIKFECTNGTFVIECYPEWAPLGVQRFRDAVEAGVYNDAGFFRVIPGFVVQFGIAGDPKLSAQWSENGILDEPVKTTNAPGTVTFAKSSAPNSRTTQMFINLGDNVRLDGMGFSPIGKIVEGMEVVMAINPEYKQDPDQELIQEKGSAYLRENFPNMDFINTATIVEKAEE